MFMHRIEFNAYATYAINSIRRERERERERESQGGSERKWGNRRRKKMRIR